MASAAADDATDRSPSAQDYGVLIDESSVRDACGALQLTKPLPHQELAIARMLGVFVNHRLPVPPQALSTHATPTLRRLASALAAAPAFGFLLTDGMGMGKTFQAIATAVILLRASFEAAGGPKTAHPSHTGRKRVLVVLNSALIATWCEQIARHWRTVDMRNDVFVYAGSGRLAKLQASSACFVFTTYETLRADANREDEVAFASSSTSHHHQHPAARRSAARRRDPRAPRDPCEEEREGMQLPQESSPANMPMHERASIFQTVPWTLIILDEVHKARNGRRSSSNSAGSGLWRTLRRFPANVPKLGLTGTPVCNHMMELCSIAQVVFKDHPVLASEDFWAEYETRFTEDVVATLRASMLLRRTLASEGIALPPRTDLDIPIVLSAPEVELYREAHGRMEAALSDLINAMERHAPPFVLKQARDRYASSVNALGRVVCGPTKCDEVVRICRTVCLGPPQEPNTTTDTTTDTTTTPRHLAPDVPTDSMDRIVVVSRFVSVLENLRTALQARAPELRCAMFTGALDWKARGAVVDAFRARLIEVVLLSTMAGNEGVDFSCAQHLVLVDSASASNPMTHEDQVVARIYRIGQTKPSCIHRLIAVGTVDDAFAFELHAQKRANAAALLDMKVSGPATSTKRYSSSSSSSPSAAEAAAESDEDDEDSLEPRAHKASGESMFRKVSSTADLLRRALSSLESLGTT